VRSVAELRERLGRNTTTPKLISENKLLLPKEAVLALAGEKSATARASGTVSTMSDYLN
jgi:hypothetical protein